MTETILNKPLQGKHLGLILGDQLDINSPLFEQLDKTHDKILMAEVIAESDLNTRLSSKQRTTLFFSAMRHFHRTLQARKYHTIYIKISEQYSDFKKVLSYAHQEIQFDKLSLVLPGDEQLRKTIQSWCHDHQVELKLLPDRHFITQQGEFQQWINGKKQPRMEFWYRHLRKTRNILMDNEKPIGGKWNYDVENRKKFGKDGPKHLRPNIDFKPQDNPIVKEVTQDIETYLPDLPGNLVAFNWPISREQALLQLGDFIEHRLPYFGDFQDAMWQEQAFLFHSLIASSLNLKLLHPMEVIQDAQQAYHDGKAPLNAVEGFIRQILGWREYVRGLYWFQKDQWLNMNYLNAQKSLPDFFWDGKTDMNCLHQSITQVLNYGYGHHIQRLMVTGLYALLYGVKPSEIERWYLAMYVDAVAWVEQPNTLGMSQYADGGFLASKPYIASGNYINRMSNYCKHCKYNPSEAHGSQACPFTTLYWDFIARHHGLIEQNPRLGMQLKNWQNKSPEERNAIQAQAKILFSSGQAKIST